MLQELILHSSDLNLHHPHPLHDHLLILKRYKAPPEQRPDLPPDNEGIMTMEITHREGRHTPYGRRIEVADIHSFQSMWGSMAALNLPHILQGFGLPQGMRRK
jgi:hypothetical protein